MLEHRLGAGQTWKEALQKGSSLTASGLTLSSAGFCFETLAAFLVLLPLICGLDAASVALTEGKESTPATRELSSVPDQA